MVKKEKIIIFDETAGKSRKGLSLRLYAKSKNIPYVTTAKELKEEIKKHG